MDKYIELLSRNRTFIMGVAILSVMLFHQGWLHSYFFKFFGFVGHFGVDIFFFVSGFGIVYSLKKNDVLTFYRRRIIRIFPPLILFGTVKFILTKYVAFFREFGSGWTLFFSFGLWFIWVILFFYLISPAILKLINKRFNGIVFLIVIVFLIFLGGGYYSFPNTIRWGVVRFPAFLLGMMIALSRPNLNDKYIRYGIIFVIFAAVFRLLRHIGLINCTDLFTFLILVFGLPSLCYWLSVVNRFLNNGILSQFFNYCGVRSLELYIVHGFVFWSIKQLQLPDVLGFLLGFSLSIIIAEVLYQTKLKVNKLFWSFNNHD